MKPRGNGSLSGSGKKRTQLLKRPISSICMRNMGVTKTTILAPVEDVPLETILSIVQDKKLRTRLTKTYEALVGRFERFLEREKGRTHMCGVASYNKYEGDWTLRRYPQWTTYPKHTRALYSAYDKSVVVIKGSGSHVKNYLHLKRSKNGKKSFGPYTYCPEEKIETRQAFGAERYPYALRQFIGALELNEVLIKEGLLGRTLIPLTIKKITAIPVITGNQMSYHTMDDIPNKDLARPLPKRIMNEVCAFVYAAKSPHL